jgi:predicted MFS family arabinose efflux permease
MSFLMRLVSPPLMGVLMAVWPATVGLEVDMAAYLIAACMLMPAWVTGPRLEAEAAPAPGAWREGWRTIRRSRALSGMLVADVFLSLVGMAAFSITVALLADVLHLGPQANAWLLGTTGVAGAVGTQLARRLAKGPGTFAALCGAIALTYLLVPVAGSLPVLMAVWSLRGLALGALGVIINQRIASEVEASVSGRVNAAWGLAACVSAFLGSASTPWLLRHLGPRGAFLLFGTVLTGLLAIAALGWMARRLRAVAPARLNEV